MQVGTIAWGFQQESCNFAVLCCLCVAYELLQKPADCPTFIRRQFSKLPRLRIHAHSSKSQTWIPPRSPSSSSRSPVCWAVPVPVEVLLKSELSSWMIPPEALSATSRAQSAKTISYACSSPNVRHAD
ncbi:hypothetical protein VTL71DRAFT_11927 [Oculimacula yallundae]|uniref:Uncharacterized protein n=1 Tax=Oculimacula yallundae TaxID=86028 RepID=A0ABR4CRU5_9HELO